MVKLSEICFKNLSGLNCAWCLNFNAFLAFTGIFTPSTSSASISNFFTALYSSSKFLILSKVYKYASLYSKLQSIFS